MASAWKTVESVETSNLQEIMSEEFARGLQDKENKKYEELLTATKPFIDAPFASRVENDSMPTTSTSEKAEETTENIRQNKLDGIPEDVLNFIRNDSELSQSVDFCDSDRMLAEMLQAAFDKEHGTLLFLFLFLFCASLKNIVRLIFR